VSFHTSVIPALERLRQEDCVFKISLATQQNLVSKKPEKQTHTYRHIYIYKQMRKLIK
jgi:hypothetical protein